MQSRKYGDMNKHLLGMQSTCPAERLGDNVDVVIYRWQNVIRRRLRGLPTIATNFNPPLAPATVASPSLAFPRRRR